MLFISQAISHLPHLGRLKLDMHSNRISDKGLQLLGNAVNQLTSLTTLSLNVGSNHIQHKGIQVL